MGNIGIGFSTFRGARPACRARLHRRREHAFVGVEPHQGYGGAPNRPRLAKGPELRTKTPPEKLKRELACPGLLMVKKFTEKHFYLPGSAWQPLFRRIGVFASRGGETVG